MHSKDKELNILKRIIRFTQEGIELEADPRRSELIVQQLGLHNAKTLSCPMVAATEAGVDVPSDNEHTTVYKSIVARASYLTADRPDIQFAVKPLAQQMAAPTEQSWQKLKRLGRYLKEEPRAVVQYTWQKSNNNHSLNIYCDSDLAGDKKSRKSTSGGVIMWGSHFIKALSKGQSVITLSSVEAELYGIIKAASEGLGLMSVLEDSGVHISGQLFTDASAALGVLGISGLGKLHHIDTSHLWLQQPHIRQKLKFSKAWGKENPADINMKALPYDEIKIHLDRINTNILGG